MSNCYFLRVTRLGVSIITVTFLHCVPIMWKIQYFLFFLFLNKQNKLNAAKITFFYYEENKKGQSKKIRIVGGDQVNRM